MLARSLHNLANTLETANPGLDDSDDPLADKRACGGLFCRLLRLRLLVLDYDAATFAAKRLSSQIPPKFGKSARRAQETEWRQLPQFFKAIWWKLSNNFVVDDA
jgi:hypothetical protein